MHVPCPSQGSASQPIRRMRQTWRPFRWSSTKKPGSACSEPDKGNIGRWWPMEASRAQPLKREWNLFDQSCGALIDCACSLLLWTFFDASSILMWLLCSYNTHKYKCSVLRCSNLEKENSMTMLHWMCADITQYSFSKYKLNIELPELACLLICLFICLFIRSFINSFFL